MLNAGKLSKVKSAGAVSAGARIEVVPLDRIERERLLLQYRLDACSVDDLVESFKREGQLVPATLWKSDLGDKLIIVDGHRRISAAEELGTDVLAVVRDDLTEEQAYRIAYEENTRRQGYGPLDRANAVQIIRRRQGVTIEQAAAFLGMTRSTAGRLVKLLDLPRPLRGAVARGKIPPNHALLLGQHPDENLDGWIEKIEEEELSIRELRKLLGKVKRGRRKSLLRRRGSGFQIAGFSYEPKKCDAATREEMVKALKQALRMLEKTPA